MRTSAGGLSAIGSMSLHLSPKCMEFIFSATEACLEGGTFRSTSGIDVGCGQGHPCQLALALGATVMVALDLPDVVRVLQQRYRVDERVIYAPYDIELLQYFDDERVGSAFDGADFMFCIIGRFSTTLQVLRAFFASRTLRVLGYMVPANPTDRNALYKYILGQNTHIWWCWIRITFSVSNEVRRVCLVSKHRPKYIHPSSIAGCVWQKAST